MDPGRRARIIRPSPQPAGVRSTMQAMGTRTDTPLLSVGHEAEWAVINREKREYHQRTARALTPSERIAQGQTLSKQAVSLLAASIRAGHVPRRAYWS
jgi:hypothetical protein